jgi:hypothetical protein
MKALYSLQESARIISGKSQRYSSDLMQSSHWKGAQMNGAEKQFDSSNLE